MRASNKDCVCISSLSKIVCFIAVISLAACSTVSQTPEGKGSGIGSEQTDGIDVEVEGVIDPYEKVNRVSYEFNLLDKYITIPVAKGYRFLVPKPLRKGINNVFTNLRTLDSAFNTFLQGKPKAGFSELHRFVLNATIGLGGLFDVATSSGLKFQNEDFGQTLAVWGYRESTYIYLPLLGPTTLRDLSGDIWVRLLMPTLLIDNTIIEAVGGIEKSSDGLLKLDEVNASALDPYSYLRTAYAQNRRHLIYDSNPPTDDFFDLLDETSFDDAPSNEVLSDEWLSTISRNEENQ